MEGFNLSNRCIIVYCSEVCRFFIYIFCLNARLDASEVTDCYFTLTACTKNENISINVQT